MLTNSCCVARSKLLCWHWQCHPLGICQSVCCSDWHSLSLAEDGRKRSKWFCYQLVADGRSTQHSTCSCCNWLTHSPPSCSPHAVFVIGQAAAAVKMLRRPFIFWLYLCKIWLLTLILDCPICTWWLVELFITKTENQPITKGSLINGRRFEQYRNICRSIEIFE